MNHPMSRISPHIAFNGNCAEAIKFYETAFKTTAQVFFYKDSPPDPNWPIPPGKENWVMQAALDVFKGFKLQLCDCSDQGSNPGTNICLQLTYQRADEITEIYNALSDGGKILCPLGKQFWADLYGEFVDKFGIRWSVMSE